MKTGLAIEDLAAEVMRENSVKLDYVVNSRDLRMETWHNNLFLRVLDQDSDRIEPLDISKNAHRQIAARLDIPAKYYSRMLTQCPALLAENVNHWFTHTPMHRMLRVLDGTMRAFVSNRYLRIDHHEVFCAVMPVLGDILGLQYVSCNITEQRMYIKIVNPNLQEQLAPDEIVQAGLVISNSETGCGSLMIQPMVYRPDTESLFISKSVDIRRIHSGPVYSPNRNFLLRPESFLSSQNPDFLRQVRDTVRTTINADTFAQIVDRMRAAKQLRMSAETIPAVVHTAGQALGITKPEQDQVTQQIYERNDFSLYGFANAVSVYSSNTESYDRATALEGIGYNVLAMNSRQWERINQAA